MDSSLNKSFLLYCGMYVLHFARVAVLENIGKFDIVRCQIAKRSNLNHPRNFQAAGRFPKNSITFDFSDRLIWIVTRIGRNTSRTSRKVRSVV